MTARTPRWLSLLTLVLAAVTSTTLAFGAGKPVANFKPDGSSSIVPAGTEPVRLWADAEFTEGPAPTADGDLLFSDIGNRILRYSPKTKQVDVFRNPSGKANGLIFDHQGNLIACEGAGQGGGRRISITPPGGKPRTLADSFEGKRFNSPNDLAVTAAGDVYFTDPRYVGNEPRELDFEAVFLVKPDGTVKLATRDVEKPNGILVSPDQKTVYVADNNSDPQGAHTLLAFDRAADGTLKNKRLLFDFGPRKRGIDGMTLDAQGNIYATGGGGDDGGIYVFAPDGKALAFIHTPGAPTNCVFGVGEHSGRLYITAGAPGTADGGAGKFGLYQCDLNTAGYHVYPPAKP